jgi:hypothetical protein
MVAHLGKKQSLRFGIFACFGTIHLGTKNVQGNSILHLATHLARRATHAFSQVNQ